MPRASRDDAELERRPALVPSRPAARTPVTILIVEDEVVIREMLGQVLEDEGYRVLYAAQGETALDILRRESVNLLLLDMMLPGLDGYGVLDAIGRSSSMGSIPVIVASAINVRRDRLRGSNVVRVLRKPLALEAFLQAILEVLRRKPSN
jgi:CheY-like chemotaxis protein